MKNINKHSDIIIEYYTNIYNEDARFENKGKRLEYITTMEYIHKFAKKGCKILEIGAGTGVYSIKLAKEGYDVTAVELVESNLEIMKQNSKGINNIRCLQGDALDLFKFKDCEFDIVLNLGPMYHLYTQKDRDLAIKESLRVCKKNGICMFAYITQSSTVWYLGIKNNNMDSVEKNLNENGKLKNVPQLLFALYDIEEFDNQFVNSNTKHLHTVATDSIAPLLSDRFDSISDENYASFVKWHLKTCENKDLLGLSCHNLYICKKL